MSSLGSTVWKTVVHALADQSGEAVLIIAEPQVFREHLRCKG